MTSSVSFVDEQNVSSPDLPPTEKDRTTTVSSRPSSRPQGHSSYSRSQSLGRVSSGRYDDRGDGRRFDAEDRYGGYDGEGMTISEFFRYGGRSGRKRESRSQNYSPRSQSLGRVEFEREERFMRGVYPEDMPRHPRDMDRFPRDMDRHPRDYPMDSYPREAYPDRYSRDMYCDRYGREFYGDRSMRPYEEKGYFAPDRYEAEKIPSDAYVSDRIEGQRFSRMGGDRIGGNDRYDRFDRYYHDRQPRMERFGIERQVQDKYDRYGRY